MALSLSAIPVRRSCPSGLVSVSFRSRLGLGSVSARFGQISASVRSDLGLGSVRFGHIRSDSAIFGQIRPYSAILASYGLHLTSIWPPSDLHMASI